MSFENWGCYIEITCDVEFGEVLVNTDFFSLVEC